MSHELSRHLLAVAAVSVLTACTAGPPVEAPAPGFTATGLASLIEVIASDEFEGRRPATTGEDRTVSFIEESFRGSGLSPGVGGSYRQAVPFVELSTRPDDSLRVAGADGRSVSLRYGDEAVYWTKRVVPQVSLEHSELVFVGYGIVEPAMGWNDYAGLDMRGKTAVILVNDPGFATDDPALF